MQGLHAIDVELVARLETRGLDPLGGLDGEEELVDGAEHLVDLADGGLVLEVHDGVELGDLDVDALADHLTLAGVEELAHLLDFGWWAGVVLLVTATATTTAAAKTSATTTTTTTSSSE